MEKETIERLILGQAQTWSGYGYVETPPEKMAFNHGWVSIIFLKSRVKSGYPVRIRCMFQGALADSFDAQFRKNDILFLTGEVEEYRGSNNATLNKIINIVNVHSFAFVTDTGGQLFPLSPEKAEWLQHCSDLYDSNSREPTPEEIIEHKKAREELFRLKAEQRKKAGIPDAKKKKT